MRVLGYAKDSNRLFADIGLSFYNSDNKEGFAI